MRVRSLADEPGKAIAAVQDGRAAVEASKAEGPLVALVIGNAAYPDDGAALAQPLNDARALAGELRARGFDVELGEDLSKQGMDQAIERFEAKITPGATALLFYSGYGVQAGRESYLLPVNAQIWRAEDVRRDGVALEPLVGELNARGAKRKLVIVDAARLGLDPGALDVLERYQRWRRFDTVAMGVTTDGLNRLFSNHSDVLRLVRDVGLGLVDRLPALKRLFIREAAGLVGEVPKLLRGEAL